MKTVTLYRPFTIEKALEDFDHYMGSFFGESPLTPARNQRYLPAVDIRETEGAYEVEAELPGYDEKNIQVHVDGSVLTIESRKEEPSEAVKDVSATSEKAAARKEVAEKGVTDNEPRFIVRERRSASFHREFRLPENADTNAISAVFKNGLLNLEIKKRPEAQKRVIEIGINQ
ncbi:molecular chaperone Hsp20 [Spirochaetia bacterium]|nr:molecular chaperone Hsp20 [Spirochaetia bacterium]